MNPNKEFLQVEELDEDYTLGELFGLIERLRKMRDLLVKRLTTSLASVDMRENLKVQSQLYYINTNIDTVEDIIIKKQEHIFQIGEYAEICLN